MLLAGHGLAAISLNLNNVDSGWINGVYYTDSFGYIPSSSIDPFLVLQSSSSIEQGYNQTNGNFNSEGDKTFTAPIKLSDLATISFGGVAYYSFLIGINEGSNSSQSLITLQSLKFWTSSSSSMSSNTMTNGLFTGSLGTLRYDLGVGNSIIYNNNKNTGLGDIIFLVPKTMFAGAKNTDYLYLYERFSGADSCYEYTATLKCPPICTLH